MGNVVSSGLSSGFQAARNFVLEKATKYIFELDDHLEDLQILAPRLEAVKVDLQNQLEMAERKGLRGLDEFKIWISEVEAIQPKVAKLLEDKTAEIERLSMCGYCSSNFILTYRYGKDVFETLEKVKGSLSSKPYGEVVARMGPPPGIEERATKRTFGLEKMLDATWSRLMEKEVGILGIYGMGGIGKTTLLKQVNEKLLEKRDEFGVVIFVVVSQNLQVGKIQNDIGERLGLRDKEWENGFQKEKASRIYDVLTRRRFVMLLDDVWRKVELEEIGIPLPSPENGSKVVFTTRLKYVCGRMGPHDLEVKLLDQKTAWELFRQKVRGNTLASDPEILHLARQLCEKCQGLPLALNIIGETIACKTSVREWQCAIDDLNTNAANYPEVKDEILEVLKLSYDDLGNETVQQCFQYCALFHKDKEIENEDLVEYWISEGIIDGGGGEREIAINRGYRIIGILISACLLIPVDTTFYETVKMHDVIRQMALWVASNFGKEEEKFIVKTGAVVHQIPEVRDWNAVRRMSLAKVEIPYISISPVCPNLTTLLLKHNNLLYISGAFFLSMPKLVILDLSYNQNLKKLPEEVSNLVSLRHLDLTLTSLENLPVGLGKLIQLRYLNLSCIRTLQSLSVISSLVNIEILWLNKVTVYLSLGLIEDIKLMKNLKSLGVTINDVVVLERLLSIPKLARCIEHIFLEGIEAEYVPFAAAIASLRSIAIEGCIFSDIMEHRRYGCTSTSAICFQNLICVYISGVSGIQDLSWLIFAPNLTFIAVKGPSPELQEIISREKVSGILNEGSSIVPFRKLHTIQLDSLVALKSIYWGRLELPCLKSIFIKNCPKLKKLPFSKERAYNFNLQEDNEEWFGGLEWEDEATED